MCRSLISASLLGLIVVCDSHADATEIDAHMTTLLSGRPDPRDGALRTVLPIYEILSLSAKGLEAPGMRDMTIVLSAWGSSDALAREIDRRIRADVDIAYIGGRIAGSRLRLRLGRQFVWDGSARIGHVDGAYGIFAVPVSGHELGAALWGGVPVAAAFGADRGDLNSGARVFWRLAGDHEVGLSAAEALDGGRVRRRDAGLDAHVQLHRDLALTTFALFSLVEERMAEADVRAVWRPFGALEVAMDGRRIAPDLFLPRTSILSVFAASRRDELGGSAAWRPRNSLRASLDLHAVLDDEHRGTNAGARVEAIAHGGRIGLEGRRLLLHDTGYRRLRLFAMAELSEPLTASLDLAAHWFDQPLNGEVRSITGVATAGYKLGDSWQAVLSGFAGAGPSFERSFEIIARIAYGGTLRAREVRP